MQEQENGGMDKYAVDETTAIPQERLEKLAAEGCPRCGRKPVKHGSSVLLCPECGSEPFEKA